MAKTKQTIALEDALDRKARENREYGCREITIGFRRQGHGDEIVDFMTMDARSVFRCYELKVSLADLKSEAKKSWYGDYNYLLTTGEVFRAVEEWEDYIPPFVGILTDETLTVRRKAQRLGIDGEQREMLKDSLIRSMFWKMNDFRDSADPEAYRSLKNDFARLQERFEAYRLETDRRNWVLEDYERYYALNHQLEGFSAENDAKVQRSQYFARKKGEFCWRNNRCPSCGNSALINENGPQLTDFCPFCGADLRHLREVF
ncbi:MAG: hypothetical protein K6D03_02065 [Solobacterium sp.]|nr:hypothetical protein [Solobacterium sp.]